MITGFDFDGTLVESWTSTPLPGARERLAALPNGTRTFIASNQAGPVFRAVLGEAKYPTVEDVAQRLADGLRALDWRPELLLICVHPGRIGDAWQRAAEDIAILLRDALIEANIGPSYWSIYSQPRYRKPDCGMLDDAIVFFPPGRLRYVGDMATDEAAARKAGARFVRARDWLAGSEL